MTARRCGLWTFITQASAHPFSSARRRAALARRRRLIRLVIARCARSCLPARFCTTVGLPRWSRRNVLARDGGSPRRVSLGMVALLPVRRRCHQDDAENETAHGTPTTCSAGWHSTGWQARLQAYSYLPGQTFTVARRPGGVASGTTVRVLTPELNCQSIRNVIAVSAEE
jgi:hypothetical protein